jgi:hypothetical protein
MGSATYRLFEQGMRERKPIVCMYHGHPRAICPIILGHTEGEETTLTFQFAGSGSKGAVTGNWKCLKLAEVSNAEIVAGPWRSGDSHKTSQSCVKEVDLDTNPNSPFSPKRRL